MGVDKANVRSVWHWAIPTSVEAYSQEAGRAGRDGHPARAVLLTGRSDLGRLVRFIQMREVEPESVSLYAQRLRAGSDSEGHLTIDAPRSDEDRIKLAIAERAGAFEVEPAPGGRLELRFNDRIDLAAARAACKAATDRSWRAYRAVESFAFGESCRRRRLLDHFGDPTPGAPEGRCCDVCDPDSWLPSPDQLEVKAKRRSSKSASPPADLSPEDEALLEALRAWRLKAARGKPAYTVANNRTLEGIATSRPGNAEHLAQSMELDLLSSGATRAMSSRSSVKGQPWAAEARRLPSRFCTDPKRGRARSSPPQTAASSNGLLAPRSKNHSVPARDLPPAPPASSPATRAVMQGNRGRDTTPEVRLRSELHARGLRFRKEVAPVPDLRCRADIVFTRAKVAVFVDGCFWHGCPEHGRIPRTNSSYWSQKLALNTRRDRRNDTHLRRSGWYVYRVWEHEEPKVVAVKVERVVATRP
jgi:DNA mismatch endonuclease Vsr